MKTMRSILGVSLFAAALLAAPVRAEEEEDLAACLESCRDMEEACYESCEHADEDKDDCFEDCLDATDKCVDACD